jgi:hypothetical protein
MDRIFFLLFGLVFLAVSVKADTTFFDQIAGEPQDSFIMTFLATPTAAPGGGYGGGLAPTPTLNATAIPVSTPAVVVAVAKGSGATGFLVLGNSADAFVSIFFLLVLAVGGYYLLRRMQQ